MSNVRLKARQSACHPATDKGFADLKTHSGIAYGEVTHSMIEGKLNLCQTIESVTAMQHKLETEYCTIRNRTVADINGDMVNTESYNRYLAIVDKLVIAKLDELDKADGS